MKTFILTSLAAMFLAVTLAVAAAPASAAGSVQSLRGDVDIPAEDKAPPIYQLKTDEPKLPRAFKEQPPLVPHKVDRYEVNLKGNRCLRCHDKDTYKDEDAPMAGKSHYVAPDGKEQDEIVKGRWFCPQCHVPQADAKPLVQNTFEGAK